MGNYAAVFSQGKVGLVTVGYAQYDAAGAVEVARTTTGVVEFDNGMYGVTVVLSVDTVFLEWDTGDADIEYAGESLAIQNELNPIEGVLGHKEIMRILLSSAALKLSGATTATMRFRNLADDADRIVATLDGNGNRTAITLNVT